VDAPRKMKTSAARERAMSGEEGLGEFPPSKVGSALQGVVEVASEEGEPAFGVGRLPAAASVGVGVGSVGGGDEAVKQVLLDGGSSGETDRVEQFGR